MSDSNYVLRNQLGQYWTRSKEWSDGREPQRLLKHKHRDEALNLLVELSAKDVDLRGEILPCEVSDRGDPVVEVSEHRTPTLAEKAAEEAANSAAAEESAADTPSDERPTEGEAAEELPPSAAVS